MFDRQPLDSLVERHVGGGTPPRSDSTFWGGSIPWASVKDFRDGELELGATEESITEAGLRASTSNLIPPGTPLVCTRMAVGRVASATVPVSINQDLRALIPTKETDNRYLLRLLASLQHRAEAQAVGSTVKGIRTADFLSMVVPVAPPREQPMIAHILDTLDTQIRRTEALIAKLEQIKQGLLTDLLTRGIDENGQLRPPPEEAPHLYKDSPLGPMPRRWNLLQLDRMTGSAICYGIVQVGPYVHDGVPVLAIKDLGGDFVLNIHRAARSVEAAYSRSRVTEGDVLLSVKGTTGRVDVVPRGFEGNISRDIARLRPNDATNSRFLCYLFDSGLGKRLLALAEVGTTRAELSIGRLRNVSVPAPPLEEQLAIASTVDELNERLHVENTAVGALRRLKNGLMDDLLTGRVRVTPLLNEPEQATG